MLAIWLPVITCSGSAENWSSEEEGICVITNGSRAGECMEKTLDLCIAFDVLYTEGEVISLENTTCMNLTGAYTLPELYGTPINETICNPSFLGIEYAFWLQDGCCVQGDISPADTEEGPYMNQYVCEQR